MTEIGISAILLILIGLLTDSFSFWMPQGLYMVFTVLFTVVFVLFVTLVWREKARDEREYLHRYIASRYAYLAGVISLVVGILVQSFSHNIDPWMAITLAVMVFAKMIGLIYSRNRH